MDLTNQLAVITGAGSGIGAAMANKCAECQANCALLDVNKTNLLAVQTELQAKYRHLKIHSFICDVSSMTQLQTTIKEIQSTFHTTNIQLLFNNVGIAAWTPVLTGDISKLHKCMNINLWSMIYATRLFLPLLLNNQQSNQQCFIVNTGSLSSLAYATDIYGITKQAVLAFTETITKELKLFKKTNPELMKCNIHCACLCPAFVETGILQNSLRMLDMNEDDAILEQRQLGLDFGITKMVAEQNAISCERVMDHLFHALKLKLGVVNTQIEWNKAVVDDRRDWILNGTPHNGKHIKAVIKKGLLNYKQNQKQPLSKSKSKL